MLHTLADHLQVVWGALLAASIVVLLTPAVGGMARLLGVVDRPEGRRLNRRTVPRLGGLALFFGIFVPALAFLDLSGETRGLLLGAAVATTVGAVDDFRGLRWWEKLGGQVAAAAIPVGFGIWVQRFTFPVIGIHTLPKWVGMPLSVLWIVAIMNMVNFLDGLDGLAAGVSAISAFTFTLIALSLPRPEVQAAILSLKLPRIDGWIGRRREIAARYKLGLAGSGLVLPRENAHSRHSYYVYVVEHPTDRDGVLERLAKRDINCNVSYRWPIHTMRGSADLGYREGQFPVAERKAQRILSLPMYPHLKDEEVDTVIEVLRDVV